MKKIVIALISSFIAYQANAVDASKEVLQIENAAFKDKPVFCEEDILDIKRNDFKLIDYELMSSESGERYALVSIKNTSSGRRILREENLVAIFSNCTSLYPQKIEQTLAGNETLTKKIYFGKNKFPIIKIITGNEI
ncbi:MAG: hypothetical protein P8J17_13040 [Halioglobus sp.]|nr:hypothetical protein [Halioglobus sp.]